MISNLKELVEWYVLNNSNWDSMMAFKVFMADYLLSKGVIQSSEEYLKVLE